MNITESKFPPGRDVGPGLFPTKVYRLCPAYQVPSSLVLNGSGPLKIALKPNIHKIGTSAYTNVHRRKLLNKIFLNLINKIKVTNTIFCGGSLSG